MNAAKHTPGPWQVVDNGDSTSLDIDDDFGMGGGRDYYLAAVRHGDPDELVANARLIAAAPELLGALQLIAEQSSEGSGSTGVAGWFGAIARAAIAKAAGAAA